MREFKQRKNNKGISENDIQTQVRDFLRYSGYFVMRHQQGLGSLKGFSDLTAIKDGKTIYIEIKKPSGTQSVHQKIFQEEIEKHGGEYLLIHSLEEIQDYMKDCK